MSGSSTDGEYETPSGDVGNAGDSSRRRFLSVLSGGVVAAALMPPTRGQLAALMIARRDLTSYGALGPPDDLGIRLPPGFSARLVGRSGERVPGTRFVWHDAPDGGACFPGRGGAGHIYVSNSEIDDEGGGVSAVAFDADGRLLDARTILDGTSRNCSGGATPWGTWLSCEENGATGQVWECDPHGGRPHRRPGLGSFNHEAAAVDAVERQVFLTEDAPDGRLYRFVPDRWTDLTSGRLSAAAVDGDAVTWLDVTDDAPDRSKATTAFHGGEGAVVVGRSLFFVTKGDRRVWELELDSSRLSVFHDCVARPDTPLTHLDNIAAHPVTGHLFVAEDGGDMDLCMLVASDNGPIVTRMLRFVGHDGSEVAGPAFSPDGRFLYVSSQRGVDGAGVTVQVQGPFAPWIATITGPATGGGSVQRVGNRHAPNG
jgi:hypothetical protein